MAILTARRDKFLKTACQIWIKLSKLSCRLFTTVESHHNAGLIRSSCLQQPRWNIDAVIGKNNHRAESWSEYDYIQKYL